LKYWRNKNKPKATPPFTITVIGTSLTSSIGNKLELIIGILEKEEEEELLL